MGLTDGFNNGRQHGGNDAIETAKPLDPYASNVHLSGLSAIQLAGLELAGVILPRLTGGAAGLIGPDGRRQKADSVAAEETAILEAMSAMAQARQQWDAQLVNVGGTMMSNAEIRNLLQRIADNPDPYVEYALAEGLIKEGEQQVFLDAMTRMNELDEIIGSGNATDAQREEFEALRETYLETAATAHAALKADHKSLALHVDAGQAASVVGRSIEHSDQRHAVRASMFEAADETAAIDEPPFAHVPPLSLSFAASIAATAPLDQPDTKPDVDQRPAEPDPALAASGFDF